MNLILSRMTACMMLVIAATASSSRAGEWRWIVSTDSQRWIEKPVIQSHTADVPKVSEPAVAPTTEPYPPPELEAAKPLTVVVDPTATAQKIEGFGGCFNENGWRALLRVDAIDRERVLRSLFDEKDGLDFNICRLPIGASDFALSAYSLDDVPGDVNLQHFSIERDRFMLIPFIKAALAIRPDLKLWASPWSPPAWMKTSGTYHGGSIKQEPAILTAYANYLARFVEDYKAEGINISAVHVQNEPGINNKYPTCLWSDPTTLREFIRDYAAPAWQSRKVPAQLWFGTITNNDFEWFKPILDDPKIQSVIGGIGLQYESRKIIKQLHARYPQFKLWQTETKCFNGANSWSEAEETFSFMQLFFRGGVSAYIYWNMVLDETGRSSWAWSQDSTIVINAYDGSIVYTPQYFLMKHLSAFVKPGSLFLKPTVEADPLLAYQLPDGSVAVLICNTSRFARTVELHVANDAASVEMPPHSFNTVLCKQ